MRKKLVIGLCGGIGSGKSTVAALLAQAGCGLIDADAIVRQLYQHESIKQQLRDHFGPQVIGPDGQVDRKWLGELVFSDPGQRCWLEALIHPLVQQRRRELLKQYQADPDLKAVVLDVPLLLEVGGKKECDWLVFVEAERVVRRQRVRAARGWDPAELARRDAAQMELKRKQELADERISNSSTLEACRRQVQQVLARRLKQPTP